MNKNALKPNRYHLLVVLIFLALSAFSYANAEEIVLKKEHPQNYVIVEGDSLWSIAARFLRDPWRWPDIWHVNPQISNPHMIFPGDEVELTFKDGQPQLVLKRARTLRNKLRTVKLSPTIRKQKLQKPIPSIPMDAIQQFLSRPNVMSKEALENAPYIIAIQNDHLVSGAGNIVYAHGIEPGNITRYSIVREGKEYTDEVDGDEISLGHEAIYIGEILVNAFGNPSTMTITQSVRESLIGDRLIPSNHRATEFNFIPQAPKTEIAGKIISVVDGVSRIGQYQTVVINRGSEHNVKRGHVLSILRKSESVDDNEGDEVNLPNVHSGYLLVFRVFTGVSYALIMKATHPIHLSDIVTNP